MIYIITYHLKLDYFEPPQSYKDNKVTSIE